MTDVLNLYTGRVTVYSCPPEQAVVAAHVQTVGKDYNTWNYPARYGHLVRRGRRVVTCGDHTALVKK